MPKREKSKTEYLYSAMLTLKNLDEAKRFFRDLLTEKEIEEMGNRFWAARGLFEGETYEKITEETGLSARTIARISDWLKNGKGGYGLILKRISNHHRSSTRGKS
ncbi:MAG: YerC/YecD family TrpR-related protein [Patescibacteria group bacterium]